MVNVDIYYKYLVCSFCIFVGSLYSHNISLQLTCHAYHHVKSHCDLQSVADGQSHEPRTDGEVETLAIDPLYHSKQGSKQNDQVPNEL